MIEMRIVEIEGCRPEFQYRYLIFGVDASGSFCPGNGWSEWKTAPYVSRMKSKND